MRIALAQLNYTVGDLAGNAAKIIAALQRAAAEGVELLITSELSLLGYPPRDLLLRPDICWAVDAALASIAPHTQTCAVIVGHVAPNPGAHGPALYNRASLFHAGCVVAAHDKVLLPTYDIFDEARYFAPGAGPTVIAWNGRRIALTICEDLWDEQHRYHRSLVGELAPQACDLLINIAASPYEHTKPECRLNVLRRAARIVGAPLIYVNQVGANDDLIFDGRSVVLNAAGEAIEQTDAFQEDYIEVITGDRTRLGMTSVLEVKENPSADLCAALTLGIRDYVRKTHFTKVYLGLSGGLDSAVVAALAVQALGSDHVVGVCMPSQFSSPGSLADAQQLANNLQIECLTYPIAELYAAAQMQVGSGRAADDPDLSEENLQARLRGIILMTLANRHSALVLATGNKSELAMGYCTLYGDLCGALAPIGDVTKTRVHALAHHLNYAREIIPAATLSKPPSAELRPNQIDQDSLPPYEILDEILEALIERADSVEQAIARGHAPALVQRVATALARTEYKRAQAPVVLKVTRTAFGPGRRMPIAAEWDI